MKIWVGVTDIPWFDYLRQRTPWVEVNHWLPGEHQHSQALEPHQLFLFKLKAPKNVIAGGGFFSHAANLPTRLAWDIFGESNGVSQFETIQEATNEYSKGQDTTGYGYEMGCIVLRQPFFFHETEWIPVPDDFSPKVSHGKTYHTKDAQGRLLYEEVLWRLNARLTQPVLFSDEASIVNDRSIYDGNVLNQRMGPKTFRVLITESYQRRCAVTREGVLPTLMATHIVPLSKGGQHRIDNGILLRSDLQQLFSMGYLTISPEGHLKISKQLEEEFGKKDSYQQLQDKEIWLPKDVQLRPKRKFLEWHNEEVFRG